MTGNKRCTTSIFFDFDDKAEFDEVMVTGIFESIKSYELFIVLDLMLDLTLIVIRVVYLIVVNLNSVLGNELYVVNT